jgi:inorganic pyrophosphatase
MNLDRVRSGSEVPNQINVIVDISAHSDPVKYELDKETGAMFVDRFFLQHYKELDEGKWIRVEGWAGLDEAKARLWTAFKCTWTPRKNRISEFFL